MARITSADSATLRMASAGRSSMTAMNMIAIIMKARTVAIEDPDRSR